MEDGYVFDNDHGLQIGIDVHASETCFASGIDFYILIVTKGIERSKNPRQRRTIKYKALFW